MSFYIKVGDFMFDRLIALVGDENFKKISTSKVLIIGLGGVGGYALEALVRGGIQNLTIIDGDTIDITNLNRQILATSKLIGKSKVEAAKERALDINPNIKIKGISEFVTEDNFEKLFLQDEYDYVIDACDDVKLKFLIMQNASKYKLISSMGTANKYDPAAFEITSLEKTVNDPLARVLRKKVKDAKINHKFKVVSSTEAVIKDDKNKNILGTNSYIPGISGLLCASYVINDILKK